MIGAGSLSRRLVRELAGVYVLTLLLSIAAFMMVAWRGGNVEADRDQGRITDLVAAAIERLPDETLVLQDSDELRDFRAANPQFRVLLIDVRTGAALRGSSPELLPFAQRGLRDVSFGELDVEAPHGLTAAIITTIELPFGSVRMITIGAHHQLYDVLHWISAELEHELLPLLIPLILGSLVIAPWIVRRGLRPITELERQAQAITPSNLEQRLDVHAAPQEVRSLLTAINKALTRIDAGFQAQRRFIANAAHEMRTPLAILRARAEKIEPFGLATELKQDLRLLSALVDQLLALARIQSRHFDLERVELVGLVRIVVAEMAPAAIALRSEISFEGTPHAIWIRGNVDGLGAALRNVVDNALRRAGGGSVDVQVGESGTIEIRDTGPDFSDAPFATGAAKQEDGRSLTIAREVIAMHGGDLSAGNHPDGGAVFRIRIPRLAA